MKLSDGLDDLAHRRLLRRWSRAGSEAEAIDFPTLRHLRGQAVALRRRLDRVVHVAEARLAVPRFAEPALSAPEGSDWSWRPNLWAGPLPKPGASAVATDTSLGGEVSLFHDCRDSELTYRQLRNTDHANQAPFCLAMDVFEFDGAFLSLAITLPGPAVRGLSQRHILQLDLLAEMERPLEVFGRLNIRHGPNTEQIVREIPIQPDGMSAEFDLAYSKLNEKRIDRVWLDLIFEGPQMNRITLNDCVLSRRLRATL